MGREIRRVPPHWESPKVQGHYDNRLQPMFDETISDAMGKWLKEFDRIRAGNMTEDECKWYPDGLADWLQNYGTPPDPDYYRPWSDDEATWFQVWETVSWGTPISPAFETKAELISYLAENGDFWDQNRCCETLGVSAWGLERAKAFVEVEWDPSFIVRGGVLSDGNLAIGESEKDVL